MSQQRFYTGYSGQMAVVAELLFRNCNAAVPAMDEGTDVFAFTEMKSEVARIQVKTSQARAYAKGGYSARFKIPMRSLKAVDKPPLFYAFAVRLSGKWVDFVIVSRIELYTYWDTHESFGTRERDRKNGDNLVIHLQFRPNRVTSSGVDFSKHRNAWSDLPPIQTLLSPRLN